LGSPVGDSRVVLEQATGRRDRQRDFSLCRSLGKKGSFIIMRRHRGFLYGLALMALSGLMTNRADAGSIELSVDLGGVVIFGPIASASPDRQITLTAAQLSTINGTLSSDGSAYRVTGLSAGSNFNGGATGFLQITAQVAVLGTVGTTTLPLSFDATQTGFLSPIGTSGTIRNAEGGSNSSNATGTISYTGDFQAVNSPTLSSTLGSSGSFSTSNGPSPIVGGVPSGYELSSHIVVNMGDVLTSTAGVTGTTTVTASGTPEPATLVMLVTGLPVPLVFMGLLRRRKAKAA